MAVDSNRNYDLPHHSSWDNNNHRSASSRAPRGGGVGGGGGTRPVHTMNMLLTIGIILQVYQIYRTPTQATTSTESTLYLQRGLRKAFLAIPIGSQESHVVDSPGSRSGRHSNNFAYNDNPDENNDELRYNNDPSSFFDNQWSNNYEELENNNQIPLPEDDVFAKNDTNANTTSSAADTSFKYSKYNYSLPAKRTNWTLTTQPKPTNESNLAVIVLSGRSNFERRQTIRNTWAKTHHNVYFVIGGPEPDNQQDMDRSNINSTSNRLFREQLLYHDLLDSIHPDTYKGLPYKLHFAVSWISHHPKMKHIQWVLKVDDDVVARINALQYYSLRNLNPASPIVIGRMEPASAVPHHGKWAEDPKWTGINGVNEYPPWAYGSTGYVMSRPVVDYIASERSFYYYQGEDVSLGIWLYESKLDVSWFDSPDFNLHHHFLADHKTSAVIGHDLSTEAMRNLFEEWKDPKILSDPIHSNHTNVKGRIYLTEARKEPEEELFDELSLEGEDYAYPMFWDSYPAVEEQEEANNNKQYNILYSITGFIMPGIVADLSDDQVELELSEPSQAPLLLYIYSTSSSSSCGGGSDACEETALQLKLATIVLGAQMRVGKLDANQYPQMAEKLRVSELPTMIVMNGQEEYHRLQGPMTNEEILQAMAVYTQQS